MKRKFLYIFFAIVISFTSTGFGFLESSTAMHKKISCHVKSDSLKVGILNISMGNPPVPQKEVQKPSNETITKSIIQWVADAVKNTVEKIITYLAKMLQSMIIDLINFFTK